MAIGKVHSRNWIRAIRYELKTKKFLKDGCDAMAGAWVPVERVEMLGTTAIYYRTFQINMSNGKSIGPSVSHSRRAPDAKFKSSRDAHNTRAHGAFDVQHSALCTLGCKLRVCLLKYSMCQRLLNSSYYNITSHLLIIK